MYILVDGLLLIELEGVLDIVLNNIGTVAVYINPLSLYYIIYWYALIIYILNDDVGIVDDGLNKFVI